MHSKLIIPILIIAVAVTDVHSGPGAEENVLTPAQQQLIKGVLQKDHWLEDDQWATVDLLLGLNNDLARIPETKKKFEIITLMMGCDYGQRFSRVLELAAIVIDRCNKLSRTRNVMKDCWQALELSLPPTSVTAIRVIRTFEHIHDTIVDDVHSNVFYQKMLQVRRFLTRRSLKEYFTGVESGLNYIDTLSRTTESLQAFLIVNCQVKYKPLNIYQLIVERGSQETYAFAITKINEHVEHVNTHLDKLGFNYDEDKGRVDFRPIPPSRSNRVVSNN